MKKTKSYGKKNFNQYYLFLSAHFTYAQKYLEFGYSGATILHPGANLGISKVITGRVNESKNRKHELTAGLQIGFYYHKNRHTAVYLNPVIAWIKTTRRGFQYGIELPIGYFRAFIPNVYEIKGSDNVSKISFAGTNHLNISPALRLSHTTGEQSFLNTWYIKSRVMMITPYVGGVTPQFLLEAGVVKFLK